MKKNAMPDKKTGQWTPAVPASKTARVGVWLPVVIGDMRRDTLGMPAEFTGMYLNLMMAMWQNNGQLGNDEIYLCRISGATHEQWLRHRQDLANLFELGDGMWSHNGIRNELRKASLISESRKAAGKKANEVRWAKERAAKQMVDSVMEKITQDGSAY